MDSKPIASSSKAFSATDPPEGAGAASGTELLAISSNHPLENEVVMDKICSFLPGKALLHCRSVNKRWNSSSIRQLRNLEPLNCIELGGGRLFSFLDFINARDKNVEWYEESIKYKLVIGPEALLSLENLELFSAQQIVGKFGPDCVGSVHLACPCYSIPRILSATALDLLQRILHQTNLETLTLRLYGSEFDTQMVAQILISTSSVNTLIFEEASKCWQYLAYEPASTNQQKVLWALARIHLNVLDNIEQLVIKIPEPSSFEILAKVTLPKLMRLKLVFSVSTVEVGTPLSWRFPDHWQHFQNFIKVNCSSLASCELKFEGEFFITKEKILEPFTKRNINFENTFPRTEFKFVSTIRRTPCLDFGCSTFSSPDMNLYEDEEEHDFFG